MQNDCIFIHIGVSFYRYINSAELRRAMRALGFKCSREDAKQMIADVNLKGKRSNLEWNYWKLINLEKVHLNKICIIFIFSQIEFTEFLEVVIDRQGDSRDMYDEILKGFSMFDYGKCQSYKWNFIHDLQRRESWIWTFCDSKVIITPGGPTF